MPRPKGKSNGNFKHGLCCGTRYGVHKYRLWQTVKSRAKNKGIEFTISLNDIPNIPKICPALGILIGPKGRGWDRDNWPSIDRIDSRLGYIPGNIRVISYRANALKSNATSDEIAAVYNDLVTIEHQEADSYCLS